MNPFESQVEYVSERFKRVTLEVVQIVDNEFYECTFSNSSFRETAFRSCRFHDCTFRDCDLSLVKVAGSSFRNTRFERCKVIGVDWTVAAWPDFLADSPISFDDCVIDYSTFIGLSLRKIGFQGCSAKDVEFSEADLSGADFRDAVLSKSRFRQTNLTEANFAGASEYSIDVTLNNVTKATFSLPEAMSLLRSLDIRLVEY